MGVETKLFLTKDEIRLDLPTFSSPQTHTRTKVKVSAPFSQGFTLRRKSYLQSSRRTVAGTPGELFVLKGGS